MIRMHPLAVIFTVAILPVTVAAQTVTAVEAIQRIQERYPAPASSTTVDTLKAGDPATPVTGIATTFLATMDVLREANRRHLNLVIAHEPTFYNHQDETAFFATDPIYQEKLSFVQEHQMVVFRLHDGIHASSPDPVALGLIAALGWQAYGKPGDPFSLTIPNTTLGKLASEVQAKLKIQTLRVVGNPDLPITHVAIRPGASGLQKQVLALHDDIDVLIAGEASEWETVEYVRDASTQGRHKALILLGHQVSEEPGMEECAKELRTLFPKLPVEHISAGQPLWEPLKIPRRKVSIQ